MNTAPESRIHLGLSAEGHSGVIARERVPRVGVWRASLRREHRLVAWRPYPRAGAPMGSPQDMLFLPPTDPDSTSMLIHVFDKILCGLDAPRLWSCPFHALFFLFPSSATTCSGSRRRVLTSAPGAR